jgi:uncharacterized protein (TIGR03083 family)
MKRAGRIDVLDRFAPLRTQLLGLLGSLSDDDWARPTAAARWCVKDVAAHLLGGEMGLLSRIRDGYTPPGRVIATYSDLVALVNRLNNEWVLAAQRLSPRVLRDLLAFTGPEVESYFATLDWEAMGGPVSWAGPEPAPVWFDLAREFTERWHHQQQIRDATGNPPLYDPYFLGPVLDTFVRGLPHSYRQVAAADGTVVRFEISGNGGGVWFLVKTGDAWELAVESEIAPVVDVVLPQDTAWRMFTKGVDGGRARQAAAIRGDAALAVPVFRTVSIIG